MDNFAGSWPFYPYRADTTIYSRDGRMVPHLIGYTFKWQGRERGSRMARKATNAQQRNVLSKAEQAGCTILETKQGWRVLLPDGKGQVTMHLTSSDHRAVENMKRDFRRQGLDLDKVVPDVSGRDIR